MSEPTTDTEKLAEREQTILDTALLESDQLLARSLHDDDQRRRRRKFWLSAFVIGGVAMSLLLIAFVMGWLTLGQPIEADAARPTIADVEKAESLAAEGWQLWRKQKMRDAADKFAEAVQLDPKAANTWNGYGWALFSSGQSAEAVDAFEKCVKLAPKHAAGLNGLGQVYLSQGKLSKARGYLLKAAPNAPAAWTGLARVSLLTDDFKKAKVWAEKLVQEDPQDEFAQKMLIAAVSGQIDDRLRKMISPSQAIEAETTSEKSTPASASTADTDADFKRGWQNFFKGKYRTSERLFRRVLESEPDNAHAMNGLGWSMLNQGNHAEAKPLLEKCLELEKNHSGAMNGLAVCLKAEGKISKAIEVWERGYATAPGPNALADGLATTYLEEKNYAQAVKYFEILAKSDASNKRYQSGLKRAKAGLAKAK